MANKYGSITVDGNLSDWTLAEELDNSATTVAGYQVYGAYLPDSANLPNYVFGVSTTGTLIGAGTTIYLNTDNNRATGYQIFGSEVGADYEVVFDSTNTPYLFSWNSTTFSWTAVGTTPLDFAISAGDTSVELAVPVADLAGAPTSIQADITLNGAAGAGGVTYLPGDFSLSDEIRAPVTVGGIVVDGNIADWPSAPLVQIPANTSPNYNVYGQLVTDATLGATYVIGVMPTAAGAADPVIGANTFIYLNTDQNASTGYTPFAGTSLGADYVIEFQPDANGSLQPYLYSATSAGIGSILNGGQPLNWSPSSAANGFEIAIPQSLLMPSGGTAPTAINFAALLNNSIGLPAVLSSQPEYTIGDPAAVTPADHTVKKIVIVYSQETANNYFAGALDANNVPIPQASLTTAYNDLFLTAQDQADAAGVPYDIITADQLATMTAAQLAQYSAVVIPSMTNVQNDAQAQQITGVLSALESEYGVGIITSGNFMTADANNALLTSPYLAMQTLLGTTFSTSGTGSYSVSVDPSATTNPIMSSYTPSELIGGASGQFAGTTTGYYSNTGYDSFAGLTGSNQVTLADINVTSNPGPGSITTSSLPGVTQTTNNGAVSTLFATDGLFGDSNLLQNVIRNAVYGSGPSLTIDMTRFAGMLDSRTDMDQSQFAADIKPEGGGPGIYDEMIPIIQQWAQQYDFVGSYYTNVGDGAPGADNAGNNLTLTAPYLKQLMQLGGEIGSHSTDHLINPPSVDANGTLIGTTVINGETVNLWSENTNTLYITAPGNNSAPLWTYNYEFGNSNTQINQALGITIAGAAVPGANDTSADAQNILPYYPSANGQEGYLNGGWTGVGSGSPNAFGYISPSNQNSVYIAPNITFDFSEVQYDKKTPTQSLADWETLFSQMSANSNTPIIVWPWHDYGVTDWNTTTDAPNAGLYSTQLFTDFVQYAYNAGYEFVTTEDLAARIAAEQRSVIKETNPTANTINVTVTPGQATDDLGAMALNLSNGGGQVIENAGSWYAYDSNSLFMAKGGVSNVTATLGATQDDVSHVDYLPMRADLQSVTGDGSNLTFSFTGDGAVDAHLKTPGTNIVSVVLSTVGTEGTGATAPTVLLIGDELEMTFNDGALAISTSSAQGVPVLHNVTITDGPTASTAAGAIIFKGPTVAITAPTAATSTAGVTISGTSLEQVEAEAVGTTVTLYDNGSTTALGTATVLADGTWSTNVTLSLGANSIVAKDTDLANMTGVSGPTVFTYAVPPTIAGTHTTQTTFDAAVHPFTGVTIGDLNPGATDALTVTLSGNGTTGKLSGTGVTGGTNGVYTLSGAAATVTSELDLLVFTPAAGLLGSVTTTTLALSDKSSASATLASDSTTTVTDTDASVAPTITGTHATPTVMDAAVNPFTGVTIGDANANATDTLTITLSGNGATGKLSGTGLGVGANGVYTLKGSAALVTSELDALVFTPAKGAAGSVTTTTFAMVDQSNAFLLPATNSATTVTDTDAAVAPTITGTHATATTSDAAVNPFAGVTIGDLNPNATDTLTITLSNNVTTSSLSGTGLTGGTNGVYTLTGAVKTVTSELDSLSFKPAVGTPGSVTTTTFALSDKSSAFATPAADSTTAVTDTDTATGTLAITSASYGTTWVLAGTAAVGSTVTVLNGTTKLGTVVATSGSWTFATALNNNAIRNFTVTASNTPTASAAYFEGTAGNDTFSFATESALSAAALINGGLGTNTIGLTAPATLTDLDFVHAQAIQALGLNGASSVTLGSNAAAAGIATVTVGNGSTSITDTNSGGLTINAAALGAANTLTLAGSSADTVTGLAGNLSATGDSGALTVTATGTTGQTVTTGSGNISIADNAAGNVTVNAAALGSSTLTLTGSATKTVNSLSSNLAVIGAATITVNAAGAAASVSVGNGNTTINGNGAAMTIDDANAKGSGHTLTLSGSATETITTLAQDLAASGVTGALNVTTSTNALSIATGSGANTINAGAMTGALTLTGSSAATLTALGGNLNATTYSGALTVTTTGGTKTVTTGSGNISITDQSTGRVTVNAASLAAAGALTLTGGGAMTVTNLKGSLVATGETGALTVTATGAAAQTITTGSGAISIADSTAGGSVTVNAAALGTGTLTLTGSAAKTVNALSGNLVATGDSGPLTIFASGGSGRTIALGSGADVVTAGPSDVITGGSGADTFVFTNPANSLYSSFDTIATFGTTDHFEIGHTVAAANFHALTAAASGNLSNDLIALLSPTNFAAQGADVLTLTGTGADAGSYVAINSDGVAGFNGGSDAVIKLTAGAANVKATSFIV